MNNKFFRFNSQKNVESMLQEIGDILNELYGKEGGILRYDYLLKAAEKFLDSMPEDQIGQNSRFNPEKPFEDLKGKIFVIAYPDNIYNDSEYTLKTLSDTLRKHFPFINGIHILPERSMSHGDIWPQDFFNQFNPEKSCELVKLMTESNLIDSNRIISPLYEKNIDTFIDDTLKKWAGEKYKSVVPEVRNILDMAFNSHFNDGGFSQKTRECVDPRFGSNKDLRKVTSQFSTMLDYVVNHLDVDNDYLDEFRKGNNDGDAFLVIYPDLYKKLIADRTLDKTFRPRPFPLFTGLRKYPVLELDGEKKTLKNCVDEMNRIFTANELQPLDNRVILFLTIYFKIENDQGLSSEDKRIFASFENFASENGIDISSFWKDSEIQAKQKIFNTAVIDSMESFIKKLDLSEKYIDLFRNDSDHIFGREFYVYTTFSESQADVNPVSEDGFKMIIDDLFYLLSSGSLSMMRMDAIKYLWKKIGCKNFDMDEGNRLIRVIRLLMILTTPFTIPLDEINSPDPIVYKMGKDGGFSYLFGQVNAVPAAFNEGTLEPLIRFNKTLKKNCPANLVRFVMLSTHDGRSVQGLGVQREDGHVTVEQFYNLKDTVESRGGKPKYRSVAKGEIAGDTFRKVFKEAQLEGSMGKLAVLFDEKTIKSSDIYRLKDQSMNEADLVEEISSVTGVSGDLLKSSPAIDYFLQWIIYGKTAYELCCTSRSAFSLTDTKGNDLAPEEESDRLVQAQLFVLTQGQDVPAIYLNDLLGLENDFGQYEITGKPRDLIRHKNYLPEMVDLIENDPFTQSYSSKLNKILELRGSDKAFYPGSPNFEFIPLSDTVFLNHPYHDNNHSLIIGNIVNRKAIIKIKTSDLSDFNLETVTNAFNEKKFSINEGFLTLEIEPFGMLWLS